MDAPPPVIPAPAAPSGPPKRHGCLLTWLILLLVLNGFLLLGNLVAPLLAKVAAQLPDAKMPTEAPWVSGVGVVLCIAAIVCIAGIFKWKKWGFFGFLGVSVALSVLAVVGGGQSVLGSLMNLLPVAVLYGVLQIGGPNKGWNQLK